MNPIPIIKMSRIPESNDIFTFNAFKIYCQDGTLTDDIGFGKLANKTLMSDLTIKPSNISNKFYRHPHWATQIIWFKFKTPRMPFDPDDNFY